MTKKVSLDDLNTKEKWEVFCDDIKELQLTDFGCSLLDVSLNVFGSGNAAYLIINIYHDNSHATEYLFKAVAGSEPRAALFAVLEENNFSLRTLLDKITTENFIDAEMGEVLVIGKLKIYKEQVVANE